MSVKKCKHCGKVNEITNYDRLKQYFEGEIDLETWNEKICGKDCPYKKAKICKDEKCLMNLLEIWLRKESK